MPHDERLENMTFDLANQCDSKPDDCCCNDALCCKSNDHCKDHRCRRTDERNESTDENQNTKSRGDGDPDALEENSSKEAVCSCHQHRSSRITGESTPACLRSSIGDLASVIGEQGDEPVPHLSAGVEEEDRDEEGEDQYRGDNGSIGYVRQSFTEQS